MKKGVYIIVMAISFLISETAFSQNSPIDKGSRIVGGGFSVVSIDRGPYKTMDLTINPSIGVFTRKRLLLGASLLFERYSANDYSSTTYGFGPDIRYYFDPDKTRTKVKGAYYPYLKVSFLYSKTMPRYDYSGYENNDYSYFDWAGAGGFQLMFSDAVGGYIELGLGSENYKDDDDDSWHSYHRTTLIAGFSFFLY